MHENVFRYNIQIEKEYETSEAVDGPVKWIITLPTHLLPEHDKLEVKFGTRVNNEKADICPFCGNSQINQIYSSTGVAKYCAKCGSYLTDGKN